MENINKYLSESIFKSNKKESSDKKMIINII